MKKLLLLSILFLSFVYAETTNNKYFDDLTCMVTEVISGDELNCLMDNKEEISITLYQVYAPKLDQPYGIEAKNALSELIQAKRVSFSEMRPHPYGQEDKRIKSKLGRRSFLADIIIFSPDKSTRDIEHEYVSFIMLSNGYAWFRNSNDNNPFSFPAEQKAKKAKRGLWISSNPIPPWEWRKK